MQQSTAAELVTKLAAELKQLASEFDTRVTRCTRERILVTSQVAAAPFQEIARDLLAQRRVRADFLPAELFHEPACDMLLALYIADEDPEPMIVKKLVATTSAPVTTSQRWIDHLHKLKLVKRITDPLDRRRIGVKLSYTGQRAIVAYLQQIRSNYQGYNILVCSLGAYT